MNIETIRHEPTSECDGRPSGTVMATTRLDSPVIVAISRHTCPECDASLCACEIAYGHDCEA